MTGVGIHDENTAFPVFSLIHHSSSLSISTWPSLFCIRSHVKHQESTVLALTCRTGCLRTWQYQVDVVIGPETRWEAQCVRGKVYCQSDSALSSRSLAVYLFPWQGNGSVTHSQTVGVSLFSWEATSIYTAFQLTASVAGAVPSASQWLSEATKERGWGLARWCDCQRPVTKHLPADRITISPRNVVPRKEEKGRQRQAGVGEAEGTGREGRGHTGRDGEWEVGR